ncbi:OLC1v1019010C1 [Oldenlandia corymbosa var. corymbosa]|uniref:OLC1v1019010C1 n=1 Tax=Oldenlandia corymbosa var. corymbosa TaxID=529605 RepID=A0AAV1ED26_OLDCO|nr:OLC1v1019010C1 [Oldenlandia corymbosa var. corymbosa]
MAIGGVKLDKLKLVIKKFIQSFNLKKASHSPMAAASNTDDESDNDIEDSVAINAGLHPIYVGNPRRRYLVSSEVMESPLFKEFMDRSCSSDANDCVMMGCEVVLFDHLIWILQNTDPKPQTLDELAKFYAC